MFSEIQTCQEVTGLPGPKNSERSRSGRAGQFPAPIPLPFAAAFDGILQNVPLSSAISERESFSSEAPSKQSIFITAFAPAAAFSADIYKVSGKMWIDWEAAAD
jgi:hypothetical protein